MGQEAFDKYQLAGLDDRDRGFTRLVEFEQAGDGYRAVLKYEAIRVRTEPHATQEIALLALIQTLQSRGYHQLRTQMSFRHGVYLGSQEIWVEYPDAPQNSRQSGGLLARLLSWLHSVRTNE